MTEQVEQQDLQMTPPSGDQWGVVITIFPNNGSGDRQVIWEHDGEFNVELAKIRFYEALYVLIEDVHTRTLEQQLAIEGDSDE